MGRAGPAKERVGGWGGGRSATSIAWPACDPEAAAGALERRQRNTKLVRRLLDRQVPQILEGLVRNRILSCRPPFPFCTPGARIACKNWPIGASDQLRLLCRVVGEHRPLLLSFFVRIFKGYLATNQESPNIGKRTKCCEQADTGSRSPIKIGGDD